MSKYELLTDFLKLQAAPRVPMSFADIERVLGTTLPQSAGNHRAWWSNNPQNNVMTKAWLDAGFESEQVDLAGRKLVFRRTDGATSPSLGLAEAASPFKPGSDTALSNKAALFGWLSGTVTMAPGVDVTEPAAPEWAQFAADVDASAA